MLSGIVTVASHPITLPASCWLWSEKVILFLLRSLMIDIVWVMMLSPVRFLPMRRASKPGPLSRTLMLTI